MPACPGLKLARLVVLYKQVLLLVNSTNSTAACPVCHTNSKGVHCYYKRTVADLSWGELSVRLLLRVRRFVCPNPKCRRSTFAERLGTEIKAYARRTTRLENRLRAIALALGGEGGAELARELGLQISPDTLLGLERSTPLTARSTPRVLGVDDFALRRGAKYGTILLDLEQGQVVEMLPNREMATFAHWLLEHPGVEIISRDRGGAYAHAARLAAPNAVQVADRFHIAKNLGETVERILRRYYPRIEQILSGVPPLPAHPSEASLVPKAGEAGTVSQATLKSSVTSQSHLKQAQLPLKRQEAEKEATQQGRLAVYEQVVSLSKQGYNQTQIGKQLGLSRKRIRQYLQAPPTPSVYTRPGTKLDPYRAYIQKRFFEEGAGNAMQLYREVVAQGYSGCRSTVISYVTQLRQQPASTQPSRRETTTKATPLRPKIGSPHQISWWFMLPEWRLSAQKRVKLAQLCQQETGLAQTYVLAQSFMRLLHAGNDKELDGWYGEAQASGSSEMQSFVRGLQTDEAAVRAGLCLGWSQGPVEGKINKVKLIKRQGYGRANFDLLRIRVLAA